MKNQFINMKKIAILCLTVLIGLTVGAFNHTNQVKAANGLPVYRVYNPNSGEHLHTLNYNESVYLAKIGWKAEGISMYAAESGNPLYRMYNPNSGEHFYTLNWNEKVSLVSSGWRYEGIAWYTPKTGTPMYRVFNPNARNAGSHHYTAAVGERDSLVRIGWKNENIAWYSVDQSAGGSTGGNTGGSGSTGGNTGGSGSTETDPWIQGFETKYESEKVYTTVPKYEDEFFIKLRTGGTKSYGTSSKLTASRETMYDEATDLGDGHIYTRPIQVGTQQVQTGTRTVEKKVTYWYKASNPSDKRYQVNKPA